MARRHTDKYLTKKSLKVHELCYLHNANEVATHNRLRRKINMSWII
uniref:Uncharacterized protein n=1 Tax=Arundo donax TaxID=35708 RepID=A0A0A9C6W1_ARUDO